MTLSFSYIAPLIDFKVSYKDAYKKRAPLPIMRAPLAIDLLLHHCLLLVLGFCTLRFALHNVYACRNDILAYTFSFIVL